MGMRKTVLLGLLWLAAACLPLQASAADVTDADARAVRAVVEAQLKALAADDAATAFSYAAPSLRTQFGNAATFMAMVKQGYPMVIKPASRAFFKPEAAGGAVVQQVHLRDADGKLWRATYELRLQPDKRWRIQGCAVAPEDENATT